ncbi:hypothetical protein QOZ80_4BG0334590 [Eleusine coracana subsp. coracana]|nr:hypothetical protein QOZ80_4BG0334590 [Eleusine coracana subsp. coracana]
MAESEAVRRVLLLDERGLHREALEDANDLAANNPGSAIFHNLRGLLLRDAAARNHGDLRTALSEMVREAYSAAAQLAPNCAWTGIAHANALADCGMYVESYEEVARVCDTEWLDDPVRHFVIHTYDNFSTGDNDCWDESYEKAQKALVNIQLRIENEVVCRVMDNLRLMNKSEADEALERVKIIAQMFPFSVRARLLYALLYLEHALSNPCDKREVLTHTLKIVREAAKVKESLVSSFVEANLLFELDDPSAIYFCRDAMSVMLSPDPRESDIPFIHSFDGEHMLDRVTAVKAQLYQIYDQTISDAYSFWGSMNMEQKNRLRTVRVDTLLKCETDNNSSEMIRNAVSFFKEHKQWGMWVYKKQSFRGSKEFLLHLERCLGTELWFKLKSVVDTEMLGDQPDLDENTNEITYTQNPNGNDVISLPSVGVMLDSIRHTSSRVENKGAEGHNILQKIRSDLDNLPEEIQGTETSPGGGPVFCPSF